MADLGNKAESIKKLSANPEELREQAGEILHDVRQRLSGAYDVASEWMEDNSITLFAIGGGILVAGLVTYFVASRRKSSSSMIDESSEKAA